MKKLFFLLLIMLPALATAQGHKGEVDECAPMRNGKVCYRDTVHVKDMSQDQIFEVINQWAKKSYAKDIFLSNVNSKKSKGTINVSSKVEMLWIVLINDIAYFCRVAVVVAIDFHLVFDDRFVCIVQQHLDFGRSKQYRLSIRSTEQ